MDVIFKTSSFLLVSSPNLHDKLEQNLHEIFHNHVDSYRNYHISPLAVNVTAPFHFCANNESLHEPFAFTVNSFHSSYVYMYIILSMLI